MNEVYEHISEFTGGTSDLDEQFKGEINSENLLIGSTKPPSASYWDSKKQQSFQRGGELQRFNVIGNGLHRSNGSNTFGNSHLRHNSQRTYYQSFQNSNLQNSVMPSSSHQLNMGDSFGNPSLSGHQDGGIPLNEGALYQSNQQQMITMQNSTFSPKKQLLENTSFQQDSSINMPRPYQQTNIGQNIDYNQLRHIVLSLPALNQMGEIKCNCLERMHLKVEQELDRLRGEFKKREMTYMSPLLNKFTDIEQKIEQAKALFNGRLCDYDQALMMQEKTIELLINSVQNMVSGRTNMAASIVNSINDSQTIRQHHSIANMIKEENQLLRKQNKQLFELTEQQQQENLLRETLTQQSNSRAKHSRNTKLYCNTEGNADQQAIFTSPGAGYIKTESTNNPMYQYLSGHKDQSNMTPSDNCSMADPIENKNNEDIQELLRMDSLSLQDQHQLQVMRQADIYCGQQQLPQYQLQQQKKPPQNQLGTGNKGSFATMRTNINSHLSLRQGAAFGGNCPKLIKSIPTSNSSSHQKKPSSYVQPSQAQSRSKKKKKQMAMTYQTIANNIKRSNKHSRKNSPTSFLFQTAPNINELQKFNWGALRNTPSMSSRENQQQLQTQQTQGLQLQPQRKQQQQIRQQQQPVFSPERLMTEPIGMQLKPESRNHLQVYRSQELQLETLSSQNQYQMGSGTKNSERILTTIPDQRLQTNPDNLFWRETEEYDS